MSTARLALAVLAMKFWVNLLCCSRAQYGSYIPFLLTRFTDQTNLMQTPQTGHEDLSKADTELLRSTRKADKIQLPNAVRNNMNHNAN